MCAVDLDAVEPGLLGPDRGGCEVGHGLLDLADAHGCCLCRRWGPRAVERQAGDARIGTRAAVVELHGGASSRVAQARGKPGKAGKVRVAGDA